MEEVVNTREPLLEMFIFETNQFLEQLENILLEAEKKDQLAKREIDEIFRMMHTTKSSSAVIGLNLLSKLSHSVEDVFYYIREENMAYNLKEIGVYDILLKVLDYMNNAISRFQKGEKEEEIEGLLYELSELLERIKKIRGVEENISKESQKDIRYKMFITFTEGAGMENIRAFNIIHVLEAYAKGIQTVPAHVVEDADAMDYIIKNGFQIFFLSKLEKKLLENIIEEMLYIKKYEIVEIAEETYNEQIKSNPIISEIKKDEIIIEQVIHQESNEKNTSLKQSLININTYKLDRLLDFVGEMSIAQSMVIKNPDLQGLDLPRFNKAARQLKKLTDELQDIVMAMRMISIGHTFYKMERVVRDMCKQLGKQAELIIIGEETEVDKSIIEHLGDPLMHLIRNAVDHGIESNDERKEKNKPEIARITLEARNTGGDIIVTLSDDGKGLDKDRILEKAHKMGFTKKTVNNLSSKEIFSFIFEPGFSTKEKVTQFSGRGVGLDVVKRYIDEMGGNIMVESEINKGTKITLRIPLTLAIVGGMQIQTGSAIYTILTTHIRESFRAKKKDIITTPEGKEYIQIREDVYPVLRLHGYFGVQPEITDLTKGMILLIENEEKRVCIFVDKLIGEQQVVIKGLPRYLEQSSIKEKGIVGCIILGDGRISLVIDVMTLLNTVF